MIMIRGRKNVLLGLFSTFLVFLALLVILVSRDEPESKRRTVVDAPDVNSESRTQLLEPWKRPVIPGAGDPAFEIKFSEDVLESQGWALDRDASFYYEIIKSNELAVQSQAQSRISPASNVLEQKALKIQSWGAWQIITSVDFEMVETYILDGGFLYNFVLSNPTNYGHYEMYRTLLETFRLVGNME